MNTSQVCGMRMSGGWNRLIGVASLVVVLLAGAGCSVEAPKNVGDSRLHEEKDYSANAEQMRLRMRSLVNPMTGKIVESADRIMEGTRDVGVQRAALLWKMEAVPALREALFQPNPKTALLDTWVFTFQMTNYFESGPGAKALGESSGIAVATSKGLEEELARVADSMTFSRDMSKAREFAKKWAAEHPMGKSIAGRESTLSLITEKEVTEAFGAAEAVGTLVVSVDDLSRRIDIYSAQMPEQMRWQVEYLVMESLGGQSLERALKLAEVAVKAVEEAVGDANKALPLMERALVVVEKSPAVIAAERDATMKALSAEITRTMTFAQEERLATLKQVTKERVLMVQELDAVLAQQRKGLAKEAEELGERAVDRAFVRALQLSGLVMLGVFVGVAVLIVFAKWVFRRGRVG